MLDIHYSLLQYLVENVAGTNTWKTCFLHRLRLTSP